MAAEIDLAANGYEQRATMPMLNTLRRSWPLAGNMSPRAMKEAIYTDIAFTEACFIASLFDAVVGWIAPDAPREMPTKNPSLRKEVCDPARRIAFSADRWWAGVRDDYHIEWKVRDARRRLEQQGAQGMNDDDETREPVISMRSNQDRIIQLENKVGELASQQQQRVARLEQTVGEMPSVLAKTLKRSRKILEHNLMRMVQEALPRMLEKAADEQIDRIREAGEAMMRSAEAQPSVPRAKHAHAESVATDRIVRTPAPLSETSRLDRSEPGADLFRDFAQTPSGIIEFASRVTPGMSFGSGATWCEIYEVRRLSCTISADPLWVVLHKADGNGKSVTLAIIRDSKQSEWALTAPPKQEE